MNLKPTLIAFALVLLCLTGHSQKSIPPETWKAITSDLSSKRNLENLRERLLQLKQEAINNHDDISVARCFYHLMQLADIKSEDTLYFKNARFTDSILQAPSSSPLIKVIMYMLKAKRILYFKTNMQYRPNRTLVSSYNAQVNYSTMNADQLEAEAFNQYSKALQLAEQVSDVPIEDLIWLSKDPLMFLFQPALTDIIYGEMISAKQTNNWPDMLNISPQWMALTQDDFSRFIDTTSHFLQKTTPVLQLYSQWMQYRKNTSPQAYYFIETLVRKHLYNAYHSDSTAKKLYTQYLESLLQSPYSAVRATAVHQLCSIWNQDGIVYNPVLTRYSTLYNERRFDSTKRMSFVKAMNLIDKYDHLMDSFPFIKDRLMEMKGSIQSSACFLHTYSNYLPGDTIPALLQFRNIKHLYTRVIRINPFDSTHFTKKNILLYLSSPYISDNALELPPTNDYQYHNTFIKLGAFPAGRYIILYSDTIINNTSQPAGFFDITVSNIAVINNDQRIFVLDRKTGFPLQDAIVMETRSTPLKNIGVLGSWMDSRPKKVNKEGYVNVNIENTSFLKVIRGNDTMMYTPNEQHEDAPEHIYSKDDYDDLMEYYEENIKVLMFTDRSIYRPGQTVHYKGIFITRNPKTGDPLVLNWKNLGLPFFKKLFYKVALKFSHEKIEMYIKDPFNREQDTIRVIPNKYGSFAGSFNIPQNAATGEWSFETDEWEMQNEGNQSFRVEEYKRPSFELTLQKPGKELYPGDSFPVKLTVRSFAGASLNNIRIRYNVKRSGYLPKANNGIVKDVYETEDIISNEEAYTNEKGEFILEINDSLLNQYNIDRNKRYDINYQVKAEAIDATGESHEEKTQFTLSTRPVQLSVRISTIVERNELLPLYINAKSAFAGPVKKPVEVALYKTQSNAIPEPPSRWVKADIWIYPEQQVRQWQDGLLIDYSTKGAEEKTLVYKTTLTAGGEDKLILPKDILTSGRYSMEITCMEKGYITGQQVQQFSVFDKQTNTLPDSTNAFHYLPVNSTSGGKEIVWITGNTKKDVFSVYHLSYYTKGNKRPILHNEYDIRVEKKGVNEWRYALPHDIIDQARLAHLYIFNNHLYKKEETIYIANSKPEPEIIVEQYRKKLSPADKGTFIVSVKTKNENTAAELMTTMYDASLDKLEPHQWNIPRFYNGTNIRTVWDENINAQLIDDQTPPHFYFNSGKSLWWLQNRTVAYDVLEYGDADYDKVYTALTGRLAGVQINDLNDVVIVGYGSARRQNALSSSVAISIRGNSSLKDYNNVLIVLDGEVYTGDINSISTGTITEGIVLKGADAVAIYGSRATNGVLLLSTKGPLQIPGMQEAPPPIIRKNFSESAFFYPQLHAGSDGFYTISFVVPESVTAWKWKMLAHTKKAAFAYAEKTVFTQLPLMVQPMMPRFLYQGDKLVLKSRITNMDSINMAGKLQCMIEDVATGENISNRLLTSPTQPFSVQGNSNTNGAFEIAVPANMLHPLRIKVTVTSASFSDGEEYVIPVLAKKILVSQSAPVTLTNTKQVTITTPTLPTDAEPYGTALYIKPQPSSAMINALPYLASYPYDCAEQTFNKMLAHLVAIKLVRTDTALQHSLRYKSQLAGKEPSPIDPAEQLTPWMQLLHANDWQQQQLNKLLDTMYSWQKTDEYTASLKGLQNPDGGMSWFKGGKSSDYISCYLLAGLGKIRRDSLLVTKDRYQRIQPLIAKLIGFCDDHFVRNLFYNESLLYMDARSYWQYDYPLSADVKRKADSLLTVNWSNINRYHFGRQVALIATTLRYAGKDGIYGQQALQQLESIRQMAIAGDGGGIRWKAISDADDLNASTEEWTVAAAEAFEAAGQSKETIAGIINWLLQEKSDHHWSTTKATSTIVSLLNRQRTNVTEAPQQLQASFNNRQLQVTDNIVSGSPYIFAATQGAGFPATIPVEKATDKPGLGAVSYYYFTAHPPETMTANGVMIRKVLSRYNDKKQQWDTLQNNATLSIADKIQVTLTIETPRFLQYVLINDNHAAGFESSDASSGYEYANGFEYYKSPHDAGMRFFAEKIPAGTSTISYEMLVNAEGSFYNGPVLLQCMYQPAVTAYGNGINITVNK